MTALATEARTLLVTALTGHGYTVVGYVPPTPKPPMIVVTPDSPWILPGRFGRLSYDVGLKVLVVISPRTAQAAVLDSENALDVVLSNLPAEFQVIQVGPPQLTDTGGQGTVTTTEITLRVSMKE